MYPRNGCFLLIYKCTLIHQNDFSTGCWDSIHVVEVQEKSSGRSAHYKLTSTSMLWLQTNRVGSGTMNLGGSLTRQIEQDASVSEASPHIANIGKMVEEMENKIR